MSGPGVIVLIGSGETAAVGRQALRWVVQRRGTPRSIQVLETPAGFEPNADAVAARWTDAIAKQAEVKDTDVAQLPLRTRRETDDPDASRALLDTDLIALGAGSPTYAVRTLERSAAWENARAAHRRGASLFMASAAAVASGAFALPVYEIYKVGEDPHWKRGLGLFDLYGLRLAVVTHWDDNSGGAGLDTSRCFVGRERFDLLREQLPDDVTVLGIDGHSALAMDPVSGTGEVLGKGGITILRDREATEVQSGAQVSLAELGPFRER